MLELDKKFNVRSSVCGNTKDVKVLQDLIISAESHNGVAVYRYGKGDSVELCHRELIDGGRKTVRHLAVLSDRLIAVQAGQRDIYFYKIEKNGNMEKLYDVDTYAMLYYRNLCPNIFGGRYFAYTSLNYGINWFEINDGVVKQLSYSLNIESCPIEDGMAVHGNCIIVISRGRYGVLKDIQQTENVAFLTGLDHKFKGTPFVFGDKLILLNRCLFYADVFDISDVYSPAFIGRASLPRPSSAECIDGKVYVCCGHNGIYELEI